MHVLEDEEWHVLEGLQNRPRDTTRVSVDVDAEVEEGAERRRRRQVLARALERRLPGREGADERGLADPGLAPDEDAEPALRAQRVKPAKELVALEQLGHGSILESALLARLWEAQVDLATSPDPASAT